jgi:hypothetical protein
MSPTKPVPVVRTRIPAAPPHQLSADTFDLFYKIVESAGKLRSRVAGLATRLRYLEAVSERRSGR